MPLVENKYEGDIVIKPETTEYKTAVKHQKTSAAGKKISWPSFPSAILSSLEFVLCTAVFALAAYSVVWITTWIVSQFVAL